MAAKEMPVHFFLCVACFVSLVTAAGTAVSWYDMAKKQGPGVCPVEEVLNDKLQIATPWTKGNFCGARTYVKMTCCQGYTRSAVPGERGCPLVLGNMEDLASTLVRANVISYLSAMKKAGLLNQLEQRSTALTVLGAQNAAFESGDKEARNGNGVHPLAYTVIQDRLPFHRLQERTRVVTGYRQENIVIHKFKTGLVTANCIPFVSTDLEGGNGVAHVTARLLKPPQHASTVDFVLRHSQLTVLASALRKAEMVEDLRQSSRIRGCSWNTLWAPVDSAWEALPDNLTKALLDDSQALRDVLNHHLTEQPWCASAVHEPWILRTRDGKTVETSCNGSSVSVGGATVLVGDIMTGDGFVHLIDTVLLPENARSLVYICQQLNLTAFLALVNRSGLLYAFENHRAFTLFAPDNAAFQALGADARSELEQSPQAIRSWLMRHMVRGTRTSGSFLDGQRLDTLDGPGPLRIRLHHKGTVTVGSAVITEADRVARNGIVHVLDKVLLSPNSSVADFLQEEERFRLFARLLNHSGLLETLDKPTDDGRSWTVFAVPDNTFPEGFAERLFLDYTLLNRLIKSYVVPGYIVTPGLQPLLIHQYQDVSGGRITLRRERKGEITVSSTTHLMERDHLCTNGVVHVLSDVLPI